MYSSRARIEIERNHDFVSSRIANTPRALTSIDIKSVPLPNLPKILPAVAQRRLVSRPAATSAMLFISVGRLKSALRASRRPTVAEHAFPHLLSLSPPPLNLLVRIDARTLVSKNT